MDIINEEGFNLQEICSAILKKTATGILLVDKDFRILKTNPAANKLLGYTEAQLLNKPLDSFIVPIVPDTVSKAVHSVFIQKDAEEIKANINFIKHDGSILFTEAAIQNHFHSTKGPVAILLFQDITEKKLAEENILANEKKIRILIEHAPAAIAMFDNNMNYITVSNRWLKDYKLKEGDVIGKSHYEVFPDIPEHWKQIHKRALAGETLRKEEDSFIRANGKTDWITWELCPWYNTDGTIGGMILFTEVVTRRKKAEHYMAKLVGQLEKKVQERTCELTKALEREKEINEMKSRFVSMASHEFRTPLSTLLSSVFILERYLQPLPDSKEAKHFNRIKASVNGLTEILDDFLSLDKLENGEIKIEKSNFDLEELANGITGEFKVILKKGQTIDFSYHGGKTILQDKKMIRNTLYNLLSNAVKFSEENKSIRLEITNVDQKVTLTVKDQGIGIPPNEQKYMFTRLFRAKNSSNIPGTGLGLNIVKKYIELLGGAISFTSELNEGTTFTVTLPC